MGLIDSMMFWRRPTAAAGATPIPRAETADSSLIRRGSLIWAGLTGFGADAASEANALSVPAVYACVNIIAGAIASLPMHIYVQDRNGDRKREYDNPLWWVLNEEFSPRWAAASGWSFLVASRLLRGDAFAEIVWSTDGRTPRYIIPIHPARVRVIATPDGQRLVYEIQPDPTVISPSAEAARVRVLDQDDVLHVPGFGFDGLNGLTPLRYALRYPGTIAADAQRFASSVMKNMGRPDYVLRTDQGLTDAQFERLQATIDNHVGPANAGKPMILEGGLKVEPLAMTLQDAQLLETRKWQVEDIARVFGVPPFMIGHTEKTTSWGSGVESMGVGFVRFTLQEHMNAFHNEMNRKFFRTTRRVAEFDTTELERADTKALFAAMRTALGRAGEPAFMTLEEVRRRLNLPAEMDGTVPQTAAPLPGDRSAPADDDSEDPEDPDDESDAAGVDDGQDADVQEDAPT